jgi:hypothetical protein
LQDFAAAFERQDIGDLETAMTLTLEEVHMILNSQIKTSKASSSQKSKFAQPAAVSPVTIGIVRRCHRVLTEYAHTAIVNRNSRTTQFLKAVPTPRSVLSRSLLHLSPDELKSALNARLNAESIFASLMLTIAASAVLAVPDPQHCYQELGIGICDVLRGSYLVAWSIACGGFSMACLVSLGSAQIFFGHASSHDVHDRYIGSEGYFNLSHDFITVGLLTGLLPGLCMNTYLRFPDLCWVCTSVSIFQWVLWLFQLCRGIRSIQNIYSEFPGYSNVLEFFRGYIPLGGTLELIPCSQVTP